MTTAICIPTFNQAAFLAQSVRSAFAQEVPGGSPLEVWLSDDASTDDTPRVVEVLQREFPVLRAVRQKKNLGMSGNPRWVVSQPETELIVKLDSDDRLRSGYVAELSALMHAHPRAGYAHCAVLEIDSVGASRRERRLARPTGFQSADDSLRALASGYRVAANICLFRREALLEVDFYKTDMSFADDWDMAVRLADAGWGNLYHASILADYRVWDDASNTRARRKMDEIHGCRRVFADSLAPAFERRSWSVEPLERERRSWALHHSIILLSAAFTPLERDDLRAALREMGPSPALERRFRLYRAGLGPLLRARNTATLRAKDALKYLLRLAKSARNSKKRNGHAQAQGQNQEERARAR